MTEAMVFIIIGLASLALLALWAKRTAAPASVGVRELSDSRETLSSLQLELPPRALVERIFDRQDWNFVSTQANPSDRRIFLQDRKVLAMAWLRHIRTNVAQLMQVHRRAVRGNVQISPSFEFALAFEYGLFLLGCSALGSLIWLRGPFCAHEAVRYTADIADQLSYASGHILASLDPARLNKIKQSRLAS